MTGAARGDDLTSSGTFLLADLALEWFGDTAVVFLFNDERFVTVNRAAGELVELAAGALSGASLERASLARFLTDNYALDPAAAKAEAAGLMAAWLGCGIFREEHHD